MTCQPARPRDPRQDDLVLMRPICIDCDDNESKGNSIECLDLDCGGCLDCGGKKGGEMEPHVQSKKRKSKKQEAQEERPIPVSS